MGDLTNALADAASRGVKVTIITNDYPSPQLRFRWQFEEKWWGVIGTFRGAGFEAKVFDKDGDASEWVVKRRGVVVAEGDNWDHRPYYHFDACLLAAEASILDAVRSAIRGHKP